MRSIPLRFWVLAIVSALFQVLPFALAGPVPQWRRVFCWFCLAPLFFLLLDHDSDGRTLRPMQATLVSYVCGILWYLGNCYWIFPTMHSFGHIPKPIAAGILLLFALYLGLYHALFGWSVSTIRTRVSRSTALLCAPFAWVAVELARARITGFPWDLMGYTQIDNLTLTRAAPWTGVFGISLLIACVNALWLVRAKAKSGWRFAGPAAALMLVLLFSMLSSFRTPVAADSTTAEAVLLQENLGVGDSSGGQGITGETKQQELHAFYGLSVRSAVQKPDLIVWPEAPADFFDEDPDFRQALGSLAKRMDAPVIADSVTVAQRQPELQIYNSASFFAPDGRHVGRYDKMHLVPFGEYTPYKQLFFFAGHLLDDVGPFIPGTTRELFNSGGHRYGVFICYESIFGDEIRQFARLGADVLVNISDDGWYGDTSAPWEHLDMVRMRAIENDRWVLRSTNTGITGAIDPHGRLVAQMPRHVRDAIEVPFGYRSDITFYTQHGDWLAWTCAALSAAVVGFSLLRRRAVNWNDAK